MRRAVGMHSGALGSIKHGQRLSQPLLFVDEDRLGLGASAREELAADFRKLAGLYR
jgi:hypothetical protein